MIKELFKLNSEYMVELNKEWISTIINFKVILKKSKPIKGDMDNRKKLYAQKIFTYIYHYADFASQFSDMDEYERHSKALENARLEDKDIDAYVKDAVKKYNELQDTQVLRLLRAAKKAIGHLEGYYTDIDFDERDAASLLVHTPKSVLDSLNGLAKVVVSVETLEEQVKKKMAEKQRARGDADIGSMEDPDNMPTFEENPNDN